uniref:Transmembrane protein 268 n=1 Tax=Sphenodon punctatus TaxID=8508 RepID=A0A8D0H5D1_SPHPU
MACKNPAQAAEKEDLLSSSFSCSSCQEDEASVCWTEDLCNGQLFMVLKACNTCSSISFDMELFAEKLKTLGIEMTAAQWRSLIHNAILEPEVRRYLFYNSSAFRILVAVIFYMSLWANIYFTLELYSFGRYWEVSILVTLAAIALTVVIILIIDRCNRKINVNTDVRLAAANEAFMKHNLLVGVTDAMDRHHNILQLWFVHFNVERCFRSIVDVIMEMKGNQESALRHSLAQLCVVMETVVHPVQETGAEDLHEESPLLPDRRGSKKGTLTCSELLQLVPDGSAEEMAQQLLVIFSGYYIRLLVSGQLPKVTIGRHVETSEVPCLCQLIETRVLYGEHSWLKTR